MHIEHIAMYVRDLESAKDFFVNVIKEVGLNSPFEDGSMEKLVKKLVR